MLKVAEGTVKSRTSRAVKRLQNVIEQDFPDLPRRRGLTLALIVLVVMISFFLLVPSVRAALIEFLQIGGVRILVSEPHEMSGEITANALERTSAPNQPVPTVDHVVSVLNLDGATTLDNARDLVDFPINLPSFHSGLGEPDQNFVSDVGTGSFVVLAWTAPGDLQEVTIGLYILGPGVRLTKGEPTVIEQIEVNGLPAVFIEGVHLLSVDGSVNPARSVSGPVLVWQMGDLTYRLEADLSKTEMLRIAESIRP